MTGIRWCCRALTAWISETSRTRIHLDLGEFSVNRKKMAALLVSQSEDVNAQAASGATSLFWALLRDQDMMRDFSSVMERCECGKGIWRHDSGLALRPQFTSLIPRNHRADVNARSDVNAEDQSGKWSPTYARGMDDHRWEDSAGETLRTRIKGGTPVPDQ